MKRLEMPNGDHITVYFSGAPLLSDAVPLVLLHGFCEEASLWDRLIPELKGIPIIAMDLPGFGQSSLPGTPEMAVYAQTVLAVLDALAVPRYVLVGHSLGGYVALELASQSGDRLVGMGLFHSHPFADNEARQAARMRGVEMVRSGKRDLYVSQLFPNLFAPAFLQAHPEVVNDMIAKGKKQPAAGIAAALLAMKSRQDHQGTLKSVACPVLFLLGEIDGLIPIEEGWLAALHPAVASVVLLPEVGHMGMLESPILCAKTLQTFYEMALAFIPLK